jgi:GNAT superfamily N-acetyltransferase
MSAPFIERAAHATPRLSVVALNEATGAVDGVFVNEDWVTPRPAAYRERLTSDWWPVRAGFSELHSRFVQARPGAIERGDTIRCMYFSCVHPRARGQGVMRGLWHSTIDTAREHGFQHLTAQAGSETVRRVLHEQLGFSEVASVRYGVWEYSEESDSDLSRFHYRNASPQTPRAPLRSRVFAELHDRDPAEFDRLSISMRKVPSDLYV